MCCSVQQLISHDTTRRRRGRNVIYTHTHTHTQIANSVMWPSSFSSSQSPFYFPLRYALRCNDGGEGGSSSSSSSFSSFGLGFSFSHSPTLAAALEPSRAEPSRAEPSDTGTVEEDTGERSEREVSPGSVQAAAAAKEDEKK